MLFDPIDSAARFQKVTMQVPAGSTGTPGNLLRLTKRRYPYDAPDERPAPGHCKPAVQVHDLRHALSGEETDLHSPPQVPGLLQREPEDAGPYDGKAVRAVSHGRQQLMRTYRSCDEPCFTIRPLCDSVPDSFMPGSMPAKASI